MAEVSWPLEHVWQQHRLQPWWAFLRQQHWGKYHPKHLKIFPKYHRKYSMPLLSGRD